MPRVVAISDIHGNLPALKAVWQDVSRRRCEHILFLGDLLAFGPHPKEVLEFFMASIKPNVSLRGNTDRYLIDRVWEQESELDPRILESLAWTADEIGADGLKALEELGDEQTYQLSDKLTVYLCHASPGNDEHGILPGQVHDLGAVIETLDASALLCGHTHRPYRSRIDGVEVANVGSVGFPFDGDTRACYFTFFVGAGAMQEVHFPRVAYGVGQAADALEACDMPHKEMFLHRLRTGTEGARKERATK